MIEQVLKEVRRATEKFPTWPTDSLHALAVLGEEYGELTKAILQMTYEPHKTTTDEVRKEATQTAAMALRLMMSLDKYIYTRCPEHEQNSQHTGGGHANELWALLAPTYTGTRIRAHGTLGRIRDGRYYKELNFACGEMLRHLEDMAQRFYSGDVRAVDEFLQLYDLDYHRPVPNAEVSGATTGASA